MSDSAPEFIDAMLRNIVGIEVTITSLVGKSKLSQEQPFELSAAPALGSQFAGTADEAGLACQREPGSNCSRIAWAASTRAEIGKFLLARITRPKRFAGTNAT